MNGIIQKLAESGIDFSDYGKFEEVTMTANMSSKEWGSSVSFDTSRKDCIAIAIKSASVYGDSAENFLSEQNPKVSPNNRIWSASNSVFAGIRFTIHDGSGTKRYSDLIVEAVLLCFTVKVNLYGASTSSYFYIPQNYVVTLKS